MKNALHPILFILIFLLILHWTPISHGAPKTKFSIVYTNDVMGEVEPCG